ncbi:prepilin-type N-terminal cleavage/methylation domain-containing protein [Acetobacter sp.]|jgi:prepilin-type N-terminal cleavage/methylation domain-containing protein|uniref:prepilin-type N-terminal cleavage/methylation domain-containing protein n=1 Tax=Acetobacter sp. TaxID=440 RepID=UPI0025C49E92|nr:prepilin-type N-terminal cleavage/methylation domain-containing protein [Acetobacter sp.]MCH4090556.1 prepilin-type N-terminal cleavage/methylation domain-containing protein [Acetobacter sp.]MCI1299250.1 prepilin-type N-terminal cleavage/methylation domain-containing protein [Acetobacter sp.]MCI1315797.1 prepilin-type N-terminal cleavage/methylation domain-containing protein [Acetobacter sp.]
MTSRTDESSRSSDAGFTLLEIMVVLVIAGLLMGMALERGPMKSDALTFAATRSRVLDSLYEAQRLSEATGDTVMLEVNTQTSQIVTVHDHVPQVGRISGPARMLLPRPGGGFFPSGDYRFTADGGASGPPLVVTLGKHFCLIRVSPVTGRIEADEG